MAEAATGKDEAEEAAEAVLAVAAVSAGEATREAGSEGPGVSGGGASARAGEADGDDI
jgi:hypothetical protein